MPVGMAAFAMRRRLSPSIDNALYSCYVIRTKSVGFKNKKYRILIRLLFLTLKVSCEFIFLLRRNRRGTKWRSSRGIVLPSGNFQSRPNWSASTEGDHEFWSSTSSRIWSRIACCTGSRCAGVWTAIREDFARFKGRVSVLDTVVPHAKAYKEAATLRVPVHRHERRHAGVMPSASAVMHQLVWELIPSLRGVYANTVHVSERSA